eukprot:3461805-Pleurochrysis_carterae.AAC.2
MAAFLAAGLLLTAKTIDHRGSDELQSFSRAGLSPSQIRRLQSLAAPPPSVSQQPSPSPVSFFSPSPSPLPGQESVFFFVQSGYCTITFDGECIQSPQYPNSYGNDEDCTINLTRPVTLIVVDFQVEEPSSAQLCEYDYLVVNSLRYCATEGPD